jgi:hypothetical protein
VADLTEQVAGFSPNKRPISPKYAIKGTMPETGEVFKPIVSYSGQEDNNTKR